jgi:hypothetical protein
MTAIADELEIRSLVHRYADAASRRDPAGVASTFTDDGDRMRLWRAVRAGEREASSSNRRDDAAVDE